MLRYDMILLMVSLPLVAMDNSEKKHLELEKVLNNAFIALTREIEDVLITEWKTPNKYVNEKPQKVLTVNPHAKESAITSAEEKILNQILVLLKFAEKAQDQTIKTQVSLEALKTYNLLDKVLSTMNELSTLDNEHNDVVLRLHKLNVLSLADQVDD